MSTKDSSRKIYRRKVLFLYPNIDDLPDDNIKEKVVDLIDSLYYIISDANEFIARAFSSDVFVNSKYIPVIEAQAINKAHDEVSQEDIHGIRLCVTSFDTYDFSDKYCHLISKEKLDENDVSHLLSIKLFPRSRKYSWKTSNDPNYSAIIETGVNELEKIIESIMLDIALYHYFRLPADLPYRQSFGVLKKEFLDVSMSSNARRVHYGSTDEKRSHIRYLPISLPHVDAIEKDPGEMKELLKKFTDLYYEYVIPDAYVDLKTNEIKFDKGNKEIPFDNPEEFDKLVSGLSKTDIEEIIELFKNQTFDENRLVLEDQDEKVILLISNKDIFPYMNTKRKKFFLKKDMEPDHYINLEESYALFHMVYLDPDEV